MIWCNSRADRIVGMKEGTAFLLRPGDPGDFFMFTGIIEQKGTVKARDEKSLAISVGKEFARNLKIGASVAVNGTCLTVTKLEKSGAFFADVMPETWQRTMLGSLKIGDAVNLELPLQASSRLDGHFVQGHVDGVAQLKKIASSADSRVLTFQSEKSITSYLVEKGSIAINGISLTVIDVRTNTFTVGIIPHTWTHTMLSEIQIGDRVNIEVDILAKYVKKLSVIKKK